MFGLRDARGMTIAQLEVKKIAGNKYHKFYMTKRTRRHAKERNIKIKRKSTQFDEFTHTFRDTH